MRAGLGFMDGGVSAPAGTFFNFARSTAATITWPVGVQAGDIAFLFDRAVNSLGLPTEVVPTDFTKIAGASGTLDNSRLTTSYKILTGAETGSLTGQDGTSVDGKVMLVFRGPAASVALSTPTFQIIDGNPSSQLVSASGQATPLLVLACASTTAAGAAFSTASPAFDGTVTSATSFPRLIAGYKVYDSAPANHTVDMNDLGDANALTALYATLS